MGVEGKEQELNKEFVNSQMLKSGIFQNWGRFYAYVGNQSVISLTDVVLGSLTVF